MPAFGDNLRREREMRAVSLEEISSATKISLRFLEAIERDDFSKLPGGIFSRSFIRSYARYLGLDEERVMAEYQLAAQPGADFDLYRLMAGKTEAGLPAKRTPLLAPLVAVALLAAGYLLFRYAPRAAEAPAAFPPPPVVATKPASNPAESPPATSGDATAQPGATPAGSNGTPTTPGTPVPMATGSNPIPPGEPQASANPAAQSSPATGSPATQTASQAANPATAKPGADTGLTLQVAATEPAWVSVDADGKNVLMRMLDPNDVQTLKAHKSFDVRTGNAQAVILTLNGETLKPLGNRGETKSVHLTRDDLKNSKP